MSELYLIAHRVRGEPAFDVATQIACAECSRQAPDVEFPEVVYTATKVDGCPECDGTGFWWIIPTSGHRAYPWEWTELQWDWLSVSEMPPGLPDHYPDRKAPSLDISSLFANLPKAPSKPIRRR